MLYALAGSFKMTEAKLAPNLPDWMLEHANRYISSGGTEGHIYRTDGWIRLRDCKPWGGAGTWQNSGKPRSYCGHIP